MRIISIYFFALICTLSSFAFSAQVLKVKGQALLIDTAGDDIQIGKTYYLMSNGKKKGIIKVIKLRPGQALAELIKGRALANWTLKERRPVTKKKTFVAAKRVAPTPKLKVVKRKSNKAKSRKSKYKKSSKDLAVGFVLGFGQNSSDVTFVGTGARNDSYTGSSLSYEVITDMKIHNKFYLRGSLGIHNFLAEDASNTQCLDSSGIVGAVCKVDLGYMNLDLWLRYYLTQGRSKFWLGAGIGILFSPKYNGTTALKEEDLATTTIMQVGGGADIRLTDKLYVPLWLEYGMFPSSDTVKMSSISGYLGLAYRL